MSTTSMFFDIFGRDKGVGEMFDKVAGHGKGVQGILGGIAGAAAGLGIAKAGEQAVDKFKEVASGAVLLQREMGGTAEDASRLNFALSQAGMSAESTQKGFGIFSKNLVASEKDAASHAKMVGELGFEYMDVHGKLLPMGEILPQLATKFKTMENGPEKTALAMKLFGKAGADMVPFLNKGGDAIGELMHKSDELGTTLSQDQVNAFKDAKKEGREWEATLTGLQVTIGGALLPVMVGLEAFVHNQLIPAITGITSWFRSLSPEMQHIVTVIGAVLLVGGPLVLVLGKFASAFSSIIGVVKMVQGAMLGLNAVLAANPFVLIILGIAALVAGLIWAYNNVGWFKDFVDSAFKIIGEVVSNVINWITGTLIPALVTGWNWAVDAVRNVVNFYQTIMGDIGRTISDGINGVVNFFVNMPSRILGALAGLGSLLVGIGKGIIDGFLNGLKAGWDAVAGFVGGIGDWIAQHKGPESYDRTLLTPHGGWIMGSLNKGLLGSLPDLRATLGVVADVVSGQKFSPSGGVFAGAASSLSSSMFGSSRNDGPFTMTGTLVLDSGETLGKFTGIARREAASAVSDANDYAGRRPSL